MIILRFWCASTSQSFGSVHQHSDIFGGTCHAWRQPDVWWKPGGINVTSCWHSFCCSKIFCGCNGTVSYSFHLACRSCFSYAKWRKRTCSQPKRTRKRSEKRHGSWGVWIQSDFWEGCRGELLHFEVVQTLLIYPRVHIWCCLTRNVYRMLWIETCKCVSIETQGSIESCRTTTAYEPVHFALLQKLTIALRFQGFCILRTICLYMLEQLSSYYITFPTPHGQCAIGPAAQAANLLITSAENGDLRKVR